MKRAFFILFLIAMAGIGMLAAEGRGAVVIYYADWTVQVQLWVLIFAILLLAILTRFFYAIAHAYQHLKQRWQHYWETRRLRRMALQQETSDHAIKALQETDSLIALKQAWQHLSHYWRHDPTLARLYVEKVVSFGGDESAANVIEWQLAHQQPGSFDLIAAYGLLTQNAATHLKQVDIWLQTRPHDPQLLLAAARLAMTNNAWGKAEHYLQKSLQQSPSIAAHLELAMVQQQLGKTELAWRSYQSAHTQSRRF